MGDIAVGDDDYELTLDEDAVRAHLQGLHTHDFDKAHRIYRRDAVLIQPQLGATITGRDNIKAARAARQDRELHLTSVGRLNFEMCGRIRSASKRSHCSSSAA